MTQPLLTKMFFLLLFAGGLSCVQSQNPGLKITPLTDSIYIYTTYKDFNGTVFPSNSMYLVTNEGVVLFDTPWDSSQLGPLLDSIALKHNKEVVMSISTHFHDDRTAGLEYLKRRGVYTYSSKQTYELCQQNKQETAEFHFRDDTLFTIGNHRFETFYPGRGHTADNIVIWFEEKKILYGGCLVKSTESKGLGNIADAHIDAWEPTVEKLIKKYRQTESVIPGHFDPSKGLSALHHTLMLLREFKQNR